LLELSRLGHSLFEAGRTDEAQVVFESIVRLGQPEAFPHAMLGTILLAKHEVDRALEHFEAALVLDPLDLPSLVYRGEIRLARKKTAKAIEDLERAIACGEETDPFVERAQRLLTLARGNRSPDARLR
jgi:tetratricopeptide (TPR) repeat protein